MKALVTGGAGFIGSHVVDGLLSEGHSVLVLDDFSSGRQDNLKAALTVSGDRLEIAKADISSAEAMKIFKNFRPDACFHLAAQINVRRSVTEPVFDSQINVAATVNMLEAARESKTSAFIFSSTGGAIYGEQDSFPASEDHATKPESPYGVSKRAAELYIEYFARKFGVTGVALRYSNVYGPRQNAKGEAGVVAIFCEKALAGQPLRVNGDGLQTRDYVFVKDVARANLLAFNAVLSGKLKGFNVFNVGTAREKSVVDLVNQLRAVASDRKFDCHHGPELPGEQRRSVIDPAAIQEQLGWSPQTSFESGVELTWKSFQVRS